MKEVIPIITTLILAATLGLAHGYEVYQHNIDDWKDPVNWEGLTCLKLGVTWTSIEEYEEKWGKIPQWQHGIETILGQGQPNQVAPRPRNSRATAGKITETAELKAIRIYLEDPDGKEVDIIQPRTIHDVQFEPPGCVSVGYLELLVITDETSNGYWKVVWEDDGKEVFSETFLVGEEPDDEDDGEDGAPFSSPGSILPYAIALIALILIAIAVYIKRR